jgi:hypothetical protein
VHKLALNTYGTVLYALLQTSIEGQYAISIINIKDMSQIKYTTIPLASASTLFATSRHLCIVSVDKGTTLLRYSHNAEFVDSTVIVSPLDEGVSAFELVDSLDGVVFLKDSTGIKRFDVNRLAWLPTLPVDWKSVGIVSFSSLAKVKDTIYIINKEESIMAKCNNCWYLHIINSTGTFTTVQGAYPGSQPEIAQTVLSENEIVAFGAFGVSVDLGRYNAQRYACVINTISLTKRYYMLPPRFSYLPSSMIHVSTNKQYYFANSNMNMIQMNPVTQEWKVIPYSPNTYKLRNNNGMLVVGDQLFYCSSEFLLDARLEKSGLVAMNLISGQIRILQDFSCKTLVAYENTLYVYRYNSSVTIVAVDVNTLKTTTIMDGCTKCRFQGVYAIPGRGVYFKAFDTIDHVEKSIVKRILQDGTTFMFCEPYSTIPRGLCIQESFEYVFDDAYQYVISNPSQPSDRKIYRYNVAGNDMRMIQYASNPMSQCRDYYQFVLDPNNVPGKRYGYLICDKVVKFDLITGNVQSTYLKDNPQVRAVALAVHGDRLWVSGQASNMFTVISDNKTAPIHWYLDEEPPVATIPTTSAGVKISLTFCLLVAALLIH